MKEVGIESVENIPITVLNHQIYLNAMGGNCPIHIVDHAHSDQRAEAIEFRRNEFGDLRVRLIRQGRFITLEKNVHRLLGVQLDNNHK